MPLILLLVVLTWEFLDVASMNRINGISGTRQEDSLAKPKILTVEIVSSWFSPLGNSILEKRKAASNVCSNQAFLATLAGANLLAKGDKGLSAALETAVRAKNRVLEVIDGLEGIELAFPNTPALNEITLSCSYASNQIMEAARRNRSSPWNRSIRTSFQG